MDPEVVGPIAIGSATAAVVIQDLVKRIAGPAADELGEWIRDKVHAVRERNLARIAERTRAMLVAAHRAPQPVALKTLVPLLEAAAWEDDDSLQELWAALLANAAGGEGTSRVLPAFPILLRQLSALDARVLDYIWHADPMKEPVEQSLKRPSTLFPRWGVSIERMQQDLGADSSDLEVTLDNLVGLGLVHDEPVIRPDWMGVPAPTTRSEARLSSFGIRFVAACQPPAASSDGEV